MRSFRSVLTILIWAAAIIPVLWFSFQQYQLTKTQARELAQQRLILNTNKHINALRIALEKSFNDLDKIATDGSIITSATVDLMSVKALDTLKGFLISNPMYENIMILDEFLFQIEAIPNDALTIDLQPFSEPIDNIFSSSSTISNPKTHIITLTDSENIDQALFAVARPILQPKESLITPFEVSGVLFSTLPLKQLIDNLLATIGQNSQKKYISIYQNDSLVYQNEPLNLSKNDFLHQVDLTVGNNDPYKITIAIEQNNQLSFIALINKERDRFYYVIALLIIILFLAKYITKRLVQPFVQLKQLTQKISNANWADEHEIHVNFKNSFKEFHELGLLLKSMSLTIKEQFYALTQNNDKLQTLTNALQESVKESEKQNEILQNLMDYALFIRSKDDTNPIGCLTLGLAYTILEHPIGLVIYRSKYQSGFMSLDNVNNEFLTITKTNRKLHFDLTEITQLNDQSQHFHITPIVSEAQSLGYIVTDKFDKNSFKYRSIDIFVTSLQSRLQELELKNELSELANTDSLTGLFNRHFLDKKLSAFSQHFNDKKEHFGVMLIDINGLKTINDTLGHAAGDELIKGVADYLLANVRTSDIITRTGGDEFIILLTDVNTEFCQRLNEKLMANLAEKPILYDNNDITMSFSCGFACTDKDPVEKLVDIADKRMYKAKSLSRH